MYSLKAHGRTIVYVQCLYSHQTRMWRHHLPTTMSLQITEFMKTQSIHLPFLGQPPLTTEPRSAAAWACHRTQFLSLSCARRLVQCRLTLRLWVEQARAARVQQGMLSPVASYCTIVTRPFVASLGGRLQISLVVRARGSLWDSGPCNWV